MKSKRSYKGWLGVAAFATAGLALITGCESKDDRNVYNAQLCIDKANPEDADDCVAMVDGIESADAYAIRCSAHYLEQGFTGTRFINAFKDIKDGGTSGSDPMLTAMGYMAFNSATAADQAVEDCNKSGKKSMIQLAAMTQLATGAASFSGLIGNVGENGLTPEQIRQAIDNIPADSYDEVGAMAENAHAAYCGEGSSFKDNEICTNLGNALEQGDAAAVGQQLLEELKRKGN